MNKNNNIAPTQPEVFFVNEMTAEVGVDVQTVQKGKNWYIDGIFLKPDIPNNNARVYTSESCNYGVKLYNDRFINTNKSIGELDHPDISEQRVDPLLKLAALKVETLSQQGSGPIEGRARVLSKTKNGKKLIALIEEGIAFGISLRALTPLQKKPDGLAYTGVPLLIKAWDAVLMPSVDHDLSSTYEGTNPLANVCSVSESGSLQHVTENTVHFNHTTGLLEARQPKIIINPRDIALAINGENT